MLFDSLKQNTILKFNFSLEIHSQKHQEFE